MVGYERGHKVHRPRYWRSAGSLDLLSAAALLPLTKVAVPHVKLPAKVGRCLIWEMPAKLGVQDALMRMPLRTSGRALGKLAR